MRRPFQSIRSQIALMAVGSIALIVICSSSLTHVLLRLSLTELIQRDLADDSTLAVRIVQGRLDGPDDLRDRRRRADLLEELSRAPFPAVVTGQSWEERLTTREIPDGLQATLSDFDPTSEESDRPSGLALPDGRNVWYIFRRVDLEGGRLGIVLWTDDAAVDRSLSNYLVWSLVAFAVATIVAAPVSWWAAGRILKPIRAMAGLVRSFEGDDTGRRLPPRDVPDDLAYLIDTFNGLLEEIDQSMRGLRQLTENAAHELRTPLAAAKIEIENALERALRDPGAIDPVEHLLSIQESLERVVRMANDLLLVASADARSLPLVIESTDLREVLRETVEVGALLADEKDVTIELVAPDRPVLVPGDRARLGRVFLNLVDNAVRYNRPRGSIVIDLDEVEDGVRITIANTGRPLAPEDRERIFDRFYRPKGDPEAKRRGGGLGLAICRSLVEAHGGSIELAASGDDGRNRFLVYLPDGGQNP